MCAQCLSLNRSERVAGNKNLGMKNHFERPRVLRLIVGLATVLCAVDPFDLPALAVEISRPTPLRHEGSRVQALPRLVQSSVVNSQPIDFDDDDDPVLKKEGVAKHILRPVAFCMTGGRSKTTVSTYTILPRGPPHGVTERTADPARRPYSSQRKLFGQLSQMFEVCQYQPSECRREFAQLHSL